MPNVFDQFDETDKNPFDKFDEKRKNPFDQFDVIKPEEMKEGGITDVILEPAKAMAGGLIGMVGSGLGGIYELIKTGDLDAAANAVTAMQQGITEKFAPETKVGQKSLENIGSAIQAVEEGVIRPAAAGTAGLVDIALNPSQLLTGAEQARGTVRAIQEKGLGKAAGEQALDVTGSPAIATAFNIAPEIMAEVGGALMGRISATAKIASAKAKTQEAKNALEDMIEGEIKGSTIENVAETIKKGDAEDIAAIIDADPDFFRALDELNISSEPLASFASRNNQYIDVEQALSSIPGSVLEPQAKLFIKELSQTADDIIVKYGGTKDKAQLGLDFKEKSLKIVDDLFEKADKNYTTLRKIIPEENRFEPKNTVAFLKDLERKDKLPPKFTRILSQLAPKTKKTKGKVIINPATGVRKDTGVTETINPKLGRIDLIRTEVGQAIKRGSGPFKDIETGLNKALYSFLYKDLDEIALNAGGKALAISELGKSLVKQRKQIEDNLKLLLGKDLNEALNVKVSGVIKKLGAKGELDKFNAVMKAIPKQQRGEVVLSAMNDVFKGSGVDQQALSPTQFVKWYKTIDRSPVAKEAIFGALPKKSKKAIDNLYTVSQGVSRALGQKIPTGRINAMFNEKTGFIRKMVGRLLPLAVAYVTKSPVASVLASNATEQFLKQSTDVAKSASDLMGSAKFQNIIRQATKEGVIEGGKASRKLKRLEEELTETKIYQNWMEDLPTEDAAMLAGGLTGYLFGGSTQSNE